MQENLALHRLYRSRRDRVLAGVAGGLGQYLNVDPTIVRLGFVLLAVVSGLGLLVYVVLTLITPVRENGEAEPAPATLLSGRETAGCVLLGLGAFILAANLGLLHLFAVTHAWLLLWTAFGVLLLLVSRARD